MQHPPRRRLSSNGVFGKFTWRRDAPTRSCSKPDITRTWRLAIICFMELGSFTVEFFEHVPPPARESTLTLFSIRGASIERHTDRIFRVVCTEPKQLSFVGQRLFSPALSRICQVTSTSGIAEVRCGLPVNRPELRGPEISRPQCSLSALAGCLFINAEHRSMLRRTKIESDDGRTPWLRTQDRRWPYNVPAGAVLGQPPPRRDVRRPY